MANNLILLEWGFPDLKVLASETTFDHWKVIFSRGKVRKRALTFLALKARFLNLHIRNPLIKSENLAKTESLLIFVLGKNGLKPYVWQCPTFINLVI